MMIVHTWKLNIPNRSISRRRKRGIPISESQFQFIKGMSPNQGATYVTRHSRNKQIGYLKIVMVESNNYALCRNLCIWARKILLVGQPSQANLAPLFREIMLKLILCCITL